MCAGGQKWDHLGTNGFALPCRSKTDGPDCEGYARLDCTSPKGRCNLRVRIKKRCKLETAVRLKQLVIIQFAMILDHSLDFFQGNCIAPCISQTLSNAHNCDFLGTLNFEIK